MRIGIDLGGTKTEAIALSREGAELARHRIASPRGDYSATLDALEGLVSVIESEVGEEGTIGIGVPGALSPSTGTLKNANSTWLIGEALDRDLAARLGRPVRLANDANCFALSEAVDGAGAGYHTVFGVILGTGVGGGIVVDGAPLGGHNAIAGEWGHNPLPWPLDGERPGPDCYCGLAGCVETFLSGPGLVADYKAGGGIESIADAQALVNAAEGGDSAAQAALARYEDRLARSLASVVNLLDPDVIVLGGGLSNIEQLYQTVPSLMQRHVFGHDATTPLSRAMHGDSSGVRGAAWLWPARA